MDRQDDTSAPLVKQCYMVSCLGVRLGDLEGEFLSEDDRLRCMAAIAVIHRLGTM